MHFEFFMNFKSCGHNRPSFRPECPLKKLNHYLFSFWVVHQNFEMMIGLSYRFIRNLYVSVFSTYKTGIMTTSNDFTTYLQVQAGVVKNFV